MLLEFWASWCGPCRAGFAPLRKTYQRFDNGKFIILGISLDTNRSEWAKAVREEQLPWAQIPDWQGMNAGIARQYCVESMPDSYLLVPDGKIMKKGLRWDCRDEFLLKIVKYIYIIYLSSS